jgi:hypothetical protein
VEEYLIQTMEWSSILHWETEHYHLIKERIVRESKESHLISMITADCILSNQYWLMKAQWIKTQCLWISLSLKEEEKLKSSQWWWCLIKSINITTQLKKRTNCSKIDRLLKKEIALLSNQLKLRSVLQLNKIWHCSKDVRNLSSIVENLLGQTRY